MLTLLQTIGCGLLTVSAFAGLCAAVRVRFGIHRFISPLVAASWIIVLLTLAGMLHMLEIACWALYVLGIASLACVYIVKRFAPPRIADSDGAPLHRLRAHAASRLQAPALR